MVVVVVVVGLPSLDTLKISNCPKLRNLHSFFPNLRVLSIKRCDSLKSLALTPFLKFLTLVQNPVLEDLEYLRGLLELEIICCPKLFALPHIFAPQKLEIGGCELLTTLHYKEVSF